MPLIPCPSCAHDVSDQATACPRCAHPLTVAPRFEGPPVNCASCGGKLKKGATATSEGSGCLIAIVGLLLVPFLIGIPILLWGLHLAGKREGFWQCQRCGTKTPRKIAAFEFV